MARRIRRVRAYTEIGKRISTLANRQRVLAKVLEVSQQTISKKLRGETAILLSDLEKLGSHYKVPLTYFFEKEASAPAVAKAVEKVKRSPGALQDLVVLLAGLPRSSVEQVLERSRLISEGKKATAAKAAEAAAPYGKSR